MGYNGYIGIVFCIVMFSYTEIKITFLEIGMKYTMFDGFAGFPEIFIIKLINIISTTMG